MRAGLKMNIIVLYAARLEPRGLYWDWWCHTPMVFRFGWIFFIFYPRGFYSGGGFSKVPGDVFIRKIFHLLPLWFFRYHSTTCNPCGFYSACGYSKVTEKRTISSSTRDDFFALQAHL